MRGEIFEAGFREAAASKDSSSKSTCMRILPLLRVTQPKRDSKRVGRGVQKCDLIRRVPMGVRVNADISRLYLVVARASSVVAILVGCDALALPFEGRVTRDCRTDDGHGREPFSASQM